MSTISQEEVLSLRKALEDGKESLRLAEEKAKRIEGELANIKAEAIAYTKQVEDERLKADQEEKKIIKLEELLNAVDMSTQRIEKEENKY